MSYCQPVQMAQPIVCHCPPMYGCGQYGCYKLRARGIKNMKLPLVDNGQQWSKSAQLSLNEKPFASSMLIPLNQFKFRHVKH